MRTPRPLGTTEKAQHITDPQQRIKEIRQDYIKEYIRNDFLVHNKRMSIDNFSNYIGTSIEDVQEEMVMEASRVDLMMDNDGLMNTLRAITSSLFRGALNDRSIALQQHSILATQQGAEYAPFLTGAVNDSIRNLFASNDQTLKILKTLLPTNGMKAFDDNLNGASGLTKGNQGLTTEKAVELIRQQGTVPLLEAPDKIKALEHQYGLDGMPEVIAHRQSGYDSGKEGLDFDKLADKQLEAMKSQDTHIDRRAHEIGEDLEADFIEQTEGPEI